MSTAHALRILAAAGLASFGCATAAAAQTEPDSLRNAYKLRVPTAEQSGRVVLEPVGSGEFSPGGGGSGGFEVWVGVSYVPRVRYYEDGGNDGNAVAGVDFGDPRSFVGVDMDVGFYSTVREGFGKRMGLDVELSRFLPLDVMLSAGWENIWSRGYSDIGASRYVSLGRWFEIRPDATWFRWIGLTLGAGDGRFVSEEDWLAGNNRINWFGAFRVEIAEPITLTLDWPGDDLTVAMTLQPIPRHDFWITPAITDATGRISTGARFMISAGYAYDVKLPF